MTNPAALYVDEDVSDLVATFLRIRGLDVITAIEQSTVGRSEHEHLIAATALNRCLLTHNRVAFKHLHFQYLLEQQQHAGIIVTPQKHPYETACRIGILVNVLSVSQITNKLLYA